MRPIIRAVLVGVALSLVSAVATSAAEKAAAAATQYKVGDTVYVCGCGESCDCNTIQTSPGKCHCGMALVEGKVTKVAAGKVTVKTAKGERVIKLT